MKRSCIEQTISSFQAHIRSCRLLVPLAWFLLGCSWVFFGLTKVRKLYLQTKVRKTTASSTRIISVGSVTVGGAGKTPVLLLLMQSLMKHRVGYVSRGYGRSTTCDVVGSFGSFSSSKLVGDEAYLVASRAPSLKLGISASKKRMVDALCKEGSLDVLFLDDGLQRYDVKADIEIGTLPDRLLFEKELLLPLGWLREPLSRLKQVDLLFILREELGRSIDELVRRAELFLPARTVIVEQRLIGWIQRDGRSCLKPCGQIAVFSGIARPERVQMLLAREGYTVVDTFFVGDHASLLSDDFLAWVQVWHSRGVTLVGTEKDWARHVPWPLSMPPCVFVQVALEPIRGKERVDMLFNSKVFI